MLPEFAYPLLTMLVSVSVGVLLAGWATPVPWKFPHYDRQLFINKLAGWGVTGGALIMALDMWVKSVL